MIERDGWYLLHDGDPLFLALHGLGAIVTALAPAKAAGVPLHRVVHDHDGDGAERESLLGIALENGAPDVVRALLAAGLDPNAPDASGDAPLFQIDRMTTEVVEAFLDAGARVNATDAEGRTPLFRACYDPANLPTVLALLAAGVNVHVTDHEEQTALHEATSNDRDSSDLVRLLLDAGADVNAVDTDGRTPLLNAALCDMESCTRLLLERGADAEQAVMHPTFPVRSTKATHKVVWTAAIAAQKRTLNAVIERNMVASRTVGGRRRL